MNVIGSGLMLKMEQQNGRIGVRHCISGRGFSDANEFGIGQQIGCIHTCQGLEIDYVGVIIGPDLLIRDGKVVTDPIKRASSDKSVFRWKKLMKEEPYPAVAELDLIIKNTYRTLMTRWMKGCYIFSDDEETRD